MDTAHALLTTPAQVQTELGTYDAPTKTEMDTAHALLATPTQVNTEVADVIRTDTTAEPGQGVPPATASLSDKVDYMYKFMINKVDESATLLQVFNAAGSVVDHKVVTSDVASLFTKGAVVSGP